MTAALRPAIRLSDTARARVHVLTGIASIVVLVVFARMATVLLVDALERREASPPTAAGRSEPSWHVLQVMPASDPAPRFTEPVPGRVGIDERHAVRVGAPLAGRVTQVFVEPGQAIEKGAPLFSVVSGELSALRAELARTEIALARARSDDRRVQSMAAMSVLPAKEALASSAQLRRAELEHRAANARLRALRVRAVSAHEFIVRAPASGVVVEKKVLPSQWVDPGLMLLQLADLTHGFWIHAEVFEQDVTGIEPGTSARVLFGSDRRELNANVEHVSAVVEPVRRSVRVRMHVRSDELRPDQHVEVSFRRPPPPGSAEVAASAVITDGAGHAVYVPDEAGRYQKRTVLVGPTFDQRALILSGLTPGERVVEQGAHVLRNRLEELF